MSQYDLLYADQVREILNTGYSDEGEDVRPRWADGTPAHTKNLIYKNLLFDGIEVPMLTTKRLAWKPAIHEIIQFYIKRTGDMSYLRENGVTIWDEWIRPDGTIGKAYGHQLGKPIIEKRHPVRGVDGWQSTNPNNLYVDEVTNQVHKLIKELKENPASRRHIISLWNIDDLWDMALPPCMWNNQWVVQDGVLHGVVGIRSNDVGLGQPFNVFQMHVLQRMLAQVTGLEVGTLRFNITNCHIYLRHEQALLEQISREPHPAPMLELDPDVKNFDDFSIDSFRLVGYEHHPTIPMEVAV